MNRALSCILCAFVFFSCALLPAKGTAEIQETESEPVTVSIYCYDNAPLKGITPYLEEKFPEVDFVVYQAVNNISFCDFLQEKGELSDIILMRRFSLNDTKLIRDQLMDLKNTEVAARFHSSILEQNKDENGEVKWLPAGAEVEGLIANRALFQEYGLEFPENYGEFKEVSRVFNENGILPFITDWKYDYTCLAMLQSWSMARLTSLDGTLWRQKYESEKPGEKVILDKELWLPVFQKLEEVIKDTYTTESDSSRRTTSVNQDFLAGKAAMIRGTGDMCKLFIEAYGIDAVMLPFFGETERENWIYSYPTFQVAINKDVKSDDGKYEVVMDILSAIFSSEGEMRTAGGNPLLSYTTTNRMELPSYFSELETLVERNHLYMRLASYEFFSTSQQVVVNMVKGLYGSAEEAFNDFNSILASPSSMEEEVLVTNHTYYPYAMTDHGNEAESALLNTLRTHTRIDEKTGNVVFEGEDIMAPDVAISYQGLMNSSFFEGDLTATEVFQMITSRKQVCYATFTGEEIEKLLKELIDVRDDGHNPIIHDNLIPVVSGFSYSIEDMGNGRFAFRGTDLQKDKIYTTLVVGYLAQLEDAYFSSTPLSVELKEKMHSTQYHAQKLIPDLLSKGYEIMKSEDYIDFMVTGK